MAIDLGQARSEQERALLDVVRRWEETYNDEVERMVAECYAPDLSAYVTGGELHGQDQLLRLELAIREAVPGRRMRIDRAFVCGDDVVVVEAAILDSARPDFFSPFCAILTIRGGRIVEDHTYLDPALWPGLEAAAPHVTAGGLGKSPHLRPTGR